MLKKNNDLTTALEKEYTKSKNKLFNFFNKNRKIE